MKSVLVRYRVWVCLLVWLMVIMSAAVSETPQSHLLALLFSLVAVAITAVEIHGNLKETADD